MLPVKISYTKESDEQSISMQGVSGVSFGIDKTEGLTVTGNVTATSGAKANNLTINGAVITGDFTTAKKVNLIIFGDDTSAVTVKVMKNAKIVLNGDVDIVEGATVPASASIALSEGSSISVNGAIGKNISITAAVGKFVGNDAPTGESVTVAGTTGTASNVTGYTIYVKKVAVASEDGTSTDYYLRAYISGNLDLADKTVEAGSISIFGIAGDAGDVSKYIYVAGRDPQH